MSKRKEIVVDIGDNQVFTADFVFEQMQAQGRRIDRANTLSVASLVASAALFVAVLAFAKLILR
jgi:hypothetical protein